MNAQERREILTRHGFIIARSPFEAARYWTRRDKLEFTVDIETGEWNQWGSQCRGDWQQFLEQIGQAAADPAAESGGTGSASPADAGEPLPPFVAECQAAGFTIDTQRGAGPHGNWFARWRGELVLLSTETASIVDRQFNALPLSGWLVRAPSLPPAAPSTPPPSPAARPADPQPAPAAEAETIDLDNRKAVIVRERVPVAATGRRLQSSLF